VYITKPYTAHGSLAVNINRVILHPTRPLAITRPHAALRNGEDRLPCYEYPSPTAINKVSLQAGVFVSLLFTSTTNQLRLALITTLDVTARLRESPFRHSSVHRKSLHDERYRS